MAKLTFLLSTFDPLQVVINTAVLACLLRWAVALGAGELPKGALVLRTPCGGGTNTRVRGFRRQKAAGRVCTNASYRFGLFGEATQPNSSEGDSLAGGGAADWRGAG